MHSRLVGGGSGGSSLLLLPLGALVVTVMDTSSGGTTDDNGLVDHPIAADSVTYLDGRWMASAELMPPRPASCSFLPNTDFHKGKRAGGHLKAITQQQCCAECAQDATCVAATFSKRGACWFKTADDLVNRSYVEGATACVVHRVHGPRHGKKVAIPATVPGDLITDLETAGLVGDPLHELNWLNSTIWGGPHSWNYSTTFPTPVAGAGTSLLVFDG
jgi:hypothetical protein